MVRIVVGIYGNDNLWNLSALVILFICNNLPVKYNQLFLASFPLSMHNQCVEKYDYKVIEKLCIYSAFDYNFNNITIFYP